MLSALSIRNVVLIDQLDVTFGPGLTALTGETGAGKSIILDALGLALGMRSARTLVRPGAAQASVTAVFALPDAHPALEILQDSGLERSPGEDLVLRRQLGADGRSRAFVNDQPVSARLLRDVGAKVLEVHGQHDGQGLLNAATHRGLLDAYAGLESEVSTLGQLWNALSAAQAQVHTLGARRARAAEDSSFVHAALEELDRLDPRPGEEQSLAGERAFLMQAQNLAQSVHKAGDLAGGDHGPQGALAAALRALEHIAPAVQEGQCPDRVRAPVQRAAAALEQALIETEEATLALDEAARALDLRPERLEQAEERLFALRAAARKHGVKVDELGDVRARFSARLDGIEDVQAQEAAAQEVLEQARQAYGQAAARLSRKRQQAGARLRQAMTRELAPLKMQKAGFRVEHEVLDAGRGGPAGCDHIYFAVATNPGAPFGPLGAIASGGELARFSLALKAALAERAGLKVMIFDEIDQGVGGAVADAVGRRLAALAGGAQVLVVTHSPQVAARAQSQIQVEKHESEEGACTRLHVLDPAERSEEIARMLAGAAISDEARAAARALLQA